MTTILGLSGSLRAGSYNTALLQAASELFPGRIEIGSIRGIPLYDGDLEAAKGVPQVVERLKDRIAAADGLLLASPEYNNAIPGVFKNAIDWLSRPPADISHVFHHKPVALMGATPGSFGTILAQNAWLPVLRTLKMRPWYHGRLMVSSADTLFDDEGRLTDEAARDRLRQFVHGFIDFC